MVEIKTLSFGDKIAYEGLIDIRIFYDLVNKWFTDRTYDTNEVLNMEQHFESGLQLTIENVPSKHLSDYAKIEHRIRIEMNELQEVKAKVEGEEKKLWKGSLSISIDTFLVTDKENRMGSDPMTFFIRTLVEKYFIRGTIDKYKEQAVRDKENFLEFVRKYLNMI